MKARPLSHCSYGFTLIEIIVVLFIIGIATGLVGIMISGGRSGGLEVRTFAKEISNVFRYARSHAVSEKKIYCFVIDREKHSISLFVEPVDYSKIELVLEKEIPDDMQINVLDADEESQFIEFFPYGNSSGGVIEISNEKGVTYLIRINSITGKLEVGKAE